MKTKHLYISFWTASCGKRTPLFAQKRAVWGHQRSVRMLHTNACMLADYVSLVGNLLQNQIKFNDQWKRVALIPLRSTCNWTRVRETFLIVRGVHWIRERTCNVNAQFPVQCDKIGPANGKAARLALEAFDAKWRKQIKFYHDLTFLQNFFDDD